MERNKNIDMVKGIGIILMIMGHAGAPFTKFIYLFHMGMFFVLSGICYNSNYTNNLSDLKKLFIKRIKSLWIPYFFINELFLIMHNFFITIGICNYDKINLKSFFVQTIKTVFFSANEELAGATWFLRVLFLVNIIYALIEYLVKRINANYLDYIMATVSIIFLLIGYYFNINNLSLKLQLDAVFSVFVLFYIGVFFRKIDLLSKIKKDVSFNILIMAICFLSLLIIGKLGEDISIANNKYSNPVLFVIATTLGLIMIYSISQILSKSSLLLRMISYIGSNTMVIILWHFVAFKVYMAILVMLNIEKYSILSSFPIYVGRSYDYLIYTCFGVLLPLLINYLYCKFKNICVNFNCRGIKER